MANAARTRMIEPRGIVTATGEIIEGNLALHAPRKENGFAKGGWFAMSLQGISHILNVAHSKQLHLSRDSLVHYALLERLDYENWIQISQSDIARRTGLLQPHVSASIKKLIATGFILVGKKVGSSWTYRLNPEFGWMGSGKNHQLALREQRMQERMQESNIRGVIRTLPTAAEQTPSVEPARDPATTDMFTGKADKELSEAEYRRQMRKIDRERAADTAARIYDEVK